MKPFSPVLTALLLLLPVAAMTRRTTSRDRENDADAISPVQRAVSLLEDVKKALETEAASDEDTRNEQACFCKTTSKEKTEAISTAEEKQQKLEVLREGGHTAEASLEKRIEVTKEMITEDEESKSTLETDRTAQANTFDTDEKQMIADISNLKNAIVVLRKTQPSDGLSLLQENSPAATSLRVVLHDISARFAIMRAANDELYHRRAPAGAGHAAFLDVASRNATSHNATSHNASLGAKLLSFLGKTSNVLPVYIAARKLKDVAHRASTASTPAFLQSEQPTSSTTEVWGILNQMLESMEEDLVSMQQAEFTGRQQYERLAALHKKQIQTGKSNLDDLQQQLAQVNVELRATDKEYDLIVEQHTADVKYLSELLASCQNMTAEAEERSRTREEEMKAISEALAIFAEDDNREHLAKSISFLQLRDSHASDERLQRSKAAEALRRIAQQPSLDLSDLVHDWHVRNDDANAAKAATAAKAAKAATARLGSHRNRLSALAASAKIDDFVQVKHAIDLMLRTLREEQAKEVEFKDDCQETLNQYDSDIYTQTEKVNDTEFDINKQQTQIDSKEREIDAANAVIAQMEEEIKKASRNREGENHAFQTTVSDQRKAQQILAAVLKRLDAFYKTKSSTATLAQTNAPEVSSPAQFKEYKNNAGTPVAMSLIQQIIDDSKRLESEAVEGERQAQVDYESFASECTQTVTTQGEEIQAAKLVVLEVKGQEGTKTNEYNSAVSLLKEHVAGKAAKENECDWLLANFDTRQLERMNEMDGLNSAKAILSGSGSK